MLGSAHDSDVDSVSTASCSDDDEIDDQAIRNMHCEFLQKRKSGMLDQIIVQRKQSLANMEFMRKMSMMMGNVTAMTKQQSDLASLQRGDSSAKPSPVAAQSGTSIGFHTNAAPMHKTNSRDRMRSGVSFTNGPSGGAPGPLTSPLTSPTAAAAASAARIPAPPQQAPSNSAPLVSSRSQHQVRIAGGFSGDKRESPSAAAAPSSSDLRSTLSNISRLGADESGTTNSRRRTRTVGFGGDGSRDDSTSVAVVGSSNPASPAVTSTTGSAVLEFPANATHRMDDALHGDNSSANHETSTNAYVQQNNTSSSGVDEAAATVSTSSGNTNPQNEGESISVAPRGSDGPGTHTSVLQSPPLHAKPRGESDNSAPTSRSPSLVDEVNTAAAVDARGSSGGGGEVAGAVVSPSNSDRESLPSSDSRGVSWSKFIPPPHSSDDQDGPIDATTAATTTTTTVAIPDDGARDEVSDNATGAGVAPHREEAREVHVPSLASLSSLVAAQHGNSHPPRLHVSPQPPPPPPPPPAHSEVPDDPLMQNDGVGAESNTSPAQRTFSRPLSLTHTPIGNVSPKPSERMLRRTHHREDGDSGIEAATQQRQQNSRESDADPHHSDSNPGSVASKENSETPTEPTTLVKVSPLPKLPVESVVNLWSKSALGLGGLLSLQRIQPPPSSLATLSDQAEDSPQAAAGGGKAEPTAAAAAADLPPVSARKPRPAEAGVGAELTPHPPRRARRQPPGRSEASSKGAMTTVAVAEAVPGDEEERPHQEQPQEQGEDAGTTTWSKSTLSHRRGAPDTSGILPADDGVDDDGDGGEAGEERQVSRETILKKEKLLQDRVKLLKNLVAPSSGVAALNGLNKKGGPPGKSPRSLVPLSLSPGKR